jgi:hypothetical protein
LLFALCAPYVLCSLPSASEAHHRHFLTVTFIFLFSLSQARTTQCVRYGPG